MEQSLETQAALVNEVSAVTIQTGLGRLGAVTCPRDDTPMPCWLISHPPDQS